MSNETDANANGFQYRGLREWIDRVDKMGELQRVKGAHWDTEMGAITHMLTEQSRGNAPAFLFGEIPDYEKGFRTLYGEFSSVRRVALTLGLPLESKSSKSRAVEVIRSRWVKRMALQTSIGVEGLRSAPSASKTSGRFSGMWRL